VVWLEESAMPSRCELENTWEDGAATSSSLLRAALAALPVMISLPFHYIFVVPFLLVIYPC
jgi:hypothetical protein